MSAEKSLSAVQTVARLRPGESYCRSVFIPYGGSRDQIKAAKRELTQLLSPVIARARAVSIASYRLHTIHSLTAGFDSIVVAVIVCEGSEAKGSDDAL